MALLLSIVNLRFGPGTWSSLGDRHDAEGGSNFDDAETEEEGDGTGMRAASSSLLSAGDFRLNDFAASSIEFFESFPSFSQRFNATANTSRPNDFRTRLNDFRTAARGPAMSAVHSS